MLNGTSRRTSVSFVFFVFTPGFPRITHLLNRSEEQ
jgi:hypothetical protein